MNETGKEVAYKQILSNMQKHVGKTIQVIGKHPHSGEYGQTIRAEIPKGLETPMMLVRLESGEQCYCDHTNCFFIIGQISISRKDTP